MLMCCCLAFTKQAPEALTSDIFQFRSVGEPWAEQAYQSGVVKHSEAA